MLRMAGARRPWYAPALTAVIGIATSAFVWHAAGEHDRRFAEAGFQRDSSERFIAIEHEVRANMATADALRGLYIASNDLSQREFGLFAQRVLAVTPSVHAVEWVPVVHETERVAFEERMRRSGSAALTINDRVDGAVMPSPARPIYYPVHFVWPWSGHTEVVGFDIGSEPARRAALGRALLRGETSLTAPIDLVAESEGERGVLAMAPVFSERHRLVAGALEAKGYAVSVIRIRDLIDNALHRFDNADLSLCVDDLSPPSPKLLYYQGADPAADAASCEALVAGAELAHSTTLTVGGRDWRLAATPNSSYVHAHFTVAPLVAALATLLLTLLLVLYVVSGQRSAAQARSDQLRRERRAEELARAVRAAQVLSEQLSYAASHDSVTGLVNRQHLEQQLGAVLRDMSTSGSHHALCYIDLDQFKVINDTGGHVAGDELLRQLGTILKARVGHRGTVARLGGDEFGILLHNCPQGHAEAVALEILDAIVSFRFVWQSSRFSIGASIGVVEISRSGQTVNDIFSAADSACFVAKDEGRNRVHLYGKSDVGLAKRHEMKWVPRIQRAVEEGRLVLYAQRIVPLRGTQHGPHYEVLVRMRDEDGALVSPSVFLPVAEQYDLMGRVDRWVVESTMDWLASHPDHVGELSCCAINLSGRSLGDWDFVRFVIGKLKGSGLPPAKICFEVTETAAIANLADAQQAISTLSGIGCRFALDDFGSGLSSFAYLKQLPVDFLKIDGLFVKDMVDDPMSHAMVKSIHEIAQVTGKRTVAEFVESPDIVSKLQAIGVDYAQGYLYGRPEPIGAMLDRAPHLTLAS